VERPNNSSPGEKERGRKKTNEETNGKLKVLVGEEKDDIFSFHHIYKRNVSIDFELSATKVRRIVLERSLIIKNDHKVFKSRKNDRKRT